MRYERPVAMLLAAFVGGTSLPVWADPSPQAPKRGFAGNTATFVNGMNTNWYYNWGRTANASARGEFIPMAWGAGAITDAGNFAQLTGHSSDYILGFNEPERADQANMTVARAIELWPQLMATGKKLVSPAVSDDAAGQTWLTDFMTQINQKGYRVDAIAFHWYGDVRPSNAASTFLSRVDWYRNTFQNKTGQKYPIWITEFAGVDWTGGVNPVTQEMNRTFLEGALAGLDSRDYVERYAWWRGHPESELGSGTPYTPTMLGKLYNGRSYDEGQTLTLAGDEGDDTFYLYGGKLQSPVAGRSIRFLDALEGFSEVGGDANWSVTNGWARIRSGATLRKYDAGTVSFSGIDVFNDGQLFVKEGVLRLSDDARVSGAGLIKTEVGSFIDLEQTAPGTGITIDNNIEMAAGRLRAKAGSHTLSGDLIMSSSSTVEVTGSLTVNGQFTGSGNLTKAGAGILKLTGNNSHTGNLTISAGTLEVSEAGTLGGGDYAGNVSNSGILKINSTANQTLRGVISGSGRLTKAGGGTLVLSGNNLFSGATTVDAGTLVVNGSIAGGAGVAVNNNAVLAGKGTIARTVSIYDTATLSPGDGVGKLTVAALVLGPTANTLIELGGPALGNDQLTISPGGALTYGGHLRIGDFGDFRIAAADGSYDLIDFGTIVPTGDFASVTINDIVLQNPLDNGLWTGRAGTTAYRFDQATGDLIVTIPEPATLGVLATSALLLLRRRNLR